MNSPTAKFSIATVLTVATGVTLGRVTFSDIFNLISHMIQNSKEQVVFPWPSDEVLTEVKDHLLDQFPWINDVAIPPKGSDPEAYYALLGDLSRRHGSQLEVKAITYA
ncbi:MAG: hypothetical protein Q4A34_00580 [Candidatus Saccharibacteria bacterium]|nr:hypothetical protein [Candidatus Saccharibacteria bacterium]